MKRMKYLMIGLLVLAGFAWYVNGASAATNSRLKHNGSGECMYINTIYAYLGSCTNAPHWERIPVSGSNYDLLRETTSGKCVYRSVGQPELFVTTCNAQDTRQHFGVYPLPYPDNLAIISRGSGLAFTKYGNRVHLLRTYETWQFID